jgi:hypothetical protein
MSTWDHKQILCLRPKVDYSNDVFMYYQYQSYVMSMCFCNLRFVWFVNIHINSFNFCWYYLVKWWRTTNLYFYLHVVHMCLSTVTFCFSQVFVCVQFISHRVVTVVPPVSENQGDQMFCEISPIPSQNHQTDDAKPMPKVNKCLAINP